MWPWLIAFCSLMVPSLIRTIWLVCAHQLAVCLCHQRKCIFKLMVTWEQESPQNFHEHLAKSQMGTEMGKTPLFHLKTTSWVTTNAVAFAGIITLFCSVLLLSLLIMHMHAERDIVVSILSVCPSVYPCQYCVEMNGHIVAPFWLSGMGIILAFF